MGLLLKRNGPSFLIMNILQYTKKLQGHDWYYMMSDDPRKYDNGLEAEKELKRLKEGKISYQKAYELEECKHFPQKYGKERNCVQKSVGQS